MKRNLKIISGRSHPDLARDIAKKLDTKLCDVNLGNFANGEISCQVGESLRGDDVFVVQSHSDNVNDALMEQAIIIDSAKRASAASVTAVCPFLAYARQDRKASGREPITARLVVDILTAAGADRIVSVDLHSGQIQGFFNGPFDHLIARPLFVDYIQKNFDMENLVIVSPDAGRVKSSERYSGNLGCSMAVIHKQRSVTTKNSVEARFLMGDVEDKVCILADDMIDTAGTLCAAADLLAENGAKEIYGLATHGVFSDPATERIDASHFTKIITTDTLPQHSSSHKIEVLSIAPMIADVVKAIYSGDSVSALFGGKNQH